MPNDVINTIANTNRARRRSDRIPNQGDDFVLEGCELSVDGTELTVKRGEITTRDGDIVYLVSVRPRTGEDVLEVPDNSQLGVYYDVGPNEIVVQASAPSGPQLQLGTVDTSVGTTAEANRVPTYESVRTEETFSTQVNDRVVGYSKQKELPSIYRTREVATDEITGIREKFWAIRNGAGDWEGYASTEETTNKINRYTSSDGINWSTDANNPVIDESGSGISLQDAAVIRDDKGVLGTAGTYYGYFENSTDGDAIRVYTSSDGVSWTFQNEFTNSYNPQSPVPHIRTDGAVVLAYEKYDSKPWTVRYASSTDGTTFTDQGTLMEGYIVVPDDWVEIGGTWYLLYHFGGRTGDDGRMLVSESQSEFGPYRGATDAQPVDRTTDGESFTVTHNPSGQADTRQRLCYGWSTANDSINVYSRTGAVIGTDELHTTPNSNADPTPKSALGAYLVPTLDKPHLYNLVGPNTGYVGGATISTDPDLNRPVLSYDGSHDVSDKTGVKEPFTRRKVTMGAIVKASSVSSEMCAVGRWAVPSELYIGVKNSNWLMRAYDGSSISSAEATGASTNTWTALFGTWDPDNRKQTLFVNGEQAATATLPSSLNEATADVNIGSSKDQKLRWNGSIAAAMVYPDTILSQSQIQTITDAWI